jgi:hypothetical protein
MARHPLPALTSYPGPLFSLAAFCGQPFDAIVARLGATSDVGEIRSLGKVIDRDRTIYLSLSPERNAVLSQRDSQDEIEIGLQRVGKCFFEHELVLVAQFAGLDLDRIQRYLNPPFRFAPDPPGERGRALWLKLVGTPYPYA